MELIHDGVASALSAEPGDCLLPLAGRFELELCYADPVSAYRAAFYPGVEQAGPRRVAFRTSEYFELLRTLLFIT